MYIKLVKFYIEKDKNGTGNNNSNNFQSDFQGTLKKFSRIGSSIVFRSLIVKKDTFFFLLFED